MRNKIEDSAGDPAGSFYHPEKRAEYAAGFNAAEKGV